MDNDGSEFGVGVEAQAPGQRGEAGAATKGCGREDRRRECEQSGAEDLGHVDGREVQGFAFGPDDLVRVGGSEPPQRIESGGGELRGLSCGGGIAARVDRRDRARQPFGGRAQCVGHGPGGGVEPTVGLRECPFQRVGGGCERIGVATTHPDAGQTTRELAEADGCQIDTEGRGRDVGEPVGFIEDHEIVIG